MIPRRNRLGARWVWVAVFALLVGAVIWKVTRPSLPLVGGYSIEKWVAMACDQKADARETVRSFGGVATPALARMLGAPEPLPSRLRGRVEAYVPNAWHRFLPERVDSSMRRRVAVMLLAGLGHDAVGARVELVRALDDDSEFVRAPAAIALGDLGIPIPEAIPGLVRLAAETNDFVRINCFPLLYRMQVPTEHAVPLLQRALGESSPELHYSALNALGAYGPQASPARQMALPFATNAAPTIRSVAIRALGRMGSPDPSTLDALSQSLKDSEFTIQVDALQALGNLGPPAKSVVPRIIEAMRNNVGGLWRHGRAALLAIAPETPEAQQILHEQ